MGASLVYLDKPNKEIEYEVGENSQIEFVAAGMQGWRLNMEDAHIADLALDEEKKLSVFGVFDGHGGGEVAQFCRRHFRDILKENDKFKKEQYEDLFRESFLNVDVNLQTESGKEELADMKRANPPNKSPIFKILGETVGNGTPNPATQTPDQMMLDSIGCTANCLIIKNNKQIVIANSGDSRSVLCRGGQAFALSEDHKPDNQEELARITKAGSYVTEGRVDGNLNLSRALGDLKYKQNKELTPQEQPITAFPDIKVVDIQPEDEYIVMGCDGIWESKSNEEMVEFVSARFKEGKNLKETIAELLEDNISPDFTQTQGVGCDNMTCIIIKLKH